MKYKKFGPEIWKKIDHAIELAKNKQTQQIAAFDADGTLWNTDLGESFFKFQINNNLLPNLPKNPWKHYRDWKESGDPRPAYLWLAQINQGQAIKTVRSWAEDCVKEFKPLPIFDEQQKLIEKLLTAKVKVYIITASVQWAVEPGAIRLGVAMENVIGVKTKIINGKITNEQDGEMTYKEGKSKALLAATKNQKPFLSCGNTLGDLSLLESSTGLQLAVGAAQSSDELFNAEEKLREEAQTRNWLIHRF